MKRLITICVTAVLILAGSDAFSTPSRTEDSWTQNADGGTANATINYGTPSPNLWPQFGTLVNFDDKAVGTPVLWNDYVSVGVASIVETEGLGFFGRYASSQSQPCYVGTGKGGERGTDASVGWDGTIVIDLALPADMVGIGVANSRGGAEVLSVYNSVGSLLESYTLAAGTNIYPYITRPSYDISRIKIYGDFFAIDDLQFNPIPEPGTLSLLALGGLALLRRRKT